MGKKNTIEKEIIVSIFERTQSINKTAKELGIGWNSCKRILNEYGIYGRPKNEVEDPYNLFELIETEEDAYWLGILYTDGWIRSDCNKIGLGSVDLDLIGKWKNYTKTENSIQIKTKNKIIGCPLPEGRICRTAKDFYTLEFSSKKTKENLIKLGCMPKKSKILQCPTEEQVPNKLLWHFFRGCVDGNGWVRYNTRYTIGLVGTQHFLEVLLTRLKILHYGTFRKKTNSEIWEFQINNKALVEKIFENMYSNATVYMNRKYNAYLTFKGRSSI